MVQFTEESAVLFVSLTWALSEIIGSRIIPRMRQKDKVKSRDDKGSRSIIWLGIFVAIALTDYFARKGITPLPEPFFYIGILLMLAGIAFRQWSIWVLGRFFSLTVRIVSDHRIVKGRTDFSGILPILEC